ncbi:hypothetical protein CBL_03570 [Carabus blaptoides fortunei]
MFLVGGSSFTYTGAQAGRVLYCLQAPDVITPQDTVQSGLQFRRSDCNIRHNHRCVDGVGTRTTRYTLIMLCIATDLEQFLFEGICNCREEKELRAALDRRLISQLCRIVREHLSPSLPGY